MSDIEAFVSAPIKLAAKINERRQGPSGHMTLNKNNSQSTSRRVRNTTTHPLCSPPTTTTRLNCAGPSSRPKFLVHLSGPSLLVLILIQLISIQLTGANQLIANNDNFRANEASSLLRHHTHYLNIVPSTHFQYNEGRQAGGRSIGEQLAQEHHQSKVVHYRDNNNDHQQLDADQLQAISSHIYKRSSAALLAAPSPIRNPPLVSSSRASLNPLSRRMMSQHEAAKSWSASQEADESGPASDDHHQNLKHQSQQGTGGATKEQHQASGGPRQDDAELLRQKQHIQYHDQWPSMAGKCHKRTLNFCASVLPFNTTTFPNIIGDTNRFEVKRSLPFFGFLAKSSCNKRLDELLCLLLEPPCSSQSGSAVPPCKKFCRLALEGCNEYIPATLALSSVFDCRQYPDSNDPNVCINLAQGSKCAPDEFKCPDKTCIPRNWLCDGVRDCIFAADEANCTGTQSSVCSTEEFKCDGKCVPKSWKCDGERDCLDGSDEESCDLRPRCGPDRFKCADGNGCIPKRWVCDGKAECRDGSDEMNCEQRDCSENDFKCDNGICVPKLWRCDHQFDCKDGSDERYCVYTTTGSPAITTTTTAVSTSTNTGTGATGDVSVSVNASYGLAAGSASAVHPQPIINLVRLQQLAQDSLEAGEMNAPANYYTTSDAGAANQQQPADLAPAHPSRQQLEANLNGDVSRIIRHESGASSPTQTTFSPAADSSQPPVPSVIGGGPEISDQPDANNNNSQAKTDYEIIQSSGNLVQLNELPTSVVSSMSGASELQNGSRQAPGPNSVGIRQQMMTQIEFATAQHHQHQHQHQQQHQQQLQQLQHPSSPSVQMTPAAGVPIDNDWNQRLNQTRPEQVAPIEHVQRIPIYRSFFKSLKGGQARAHLVGGHGGYQRNVVTVARRRRDRHHVAPLGQQTDGEQPTVDHASHLAPELAGGQRLPMVGMGLHNQTQARRYHNGMPSYLHMLNNRYNLRLPRVSPSLA